ncbi:MAG: MBL fold metallo-hydrolase [Mogibacterium sp.]|nr:MBL fold metallo-hydrolase [Mogibacterium sp.]
MSITVKCFPCGPEAENTYLITDDVTGLQAVIDPGYYGEDIRSLIQDGNSLRYILLTHGHYDHFAAAEEYRNEFRDAVFAVPANEEYLLHGGRDNKWMALGRGTGICPESDIKLSEGDSITLGETVINVIETPGHTEGSICFCTDKELFSGDTLFRQAVGNPRLETGDRTALEDSIRGRLYSLDEELTVWPGHGPATTIGFEKKNNPVVPWIGPDAIAH